MKRREMRPACKLVVNRALADAVTRQLSLALFTDAKLDLGGTRARAGSVEMGSRRCGSEKER